MDSSYRTRMSVFFGGVLLALSQAGNAVTVAETPLFIATSVTPNVMLVVDNSGSMQSIIWATGFNPQTIYSDWSRVNNGASAWASTSGSITNTSLISSTWRTSGSGVDCNTNWTRGKTSAGTTKCLRLPDPVGGGATRWSGNYLNYLFVTFANNTDLRSGQIPNDYRMNVARNVATSVVTSNTNLRLGLFKFNTDQGGVMLQACNTGNTAALTTSIAGLSATTWTPLAEALYDVTRYFRGLTSYYNAGVAYVSPIQYRCQKNFVIVITDGYPTQDTDFPSGANTDPADSADTTRSLPNWDGLAPTTTAAMYPNFPAGSDGFKPSGATTDEGHTLYLDDIAKFGFDIDLRTTGNDLTGTSFNDVSFPKQNLVTYTVGFTAANQMLADAATNGTGVYYQANNEAELTTALQAAFADISARTSSASSVATNTTRLAANSFIFQARFNTGDWTGDLLAFPIGENGSIGSLDSNGIPALGSRKGWTAAQEMPDPGDRNIYTYNPGSGTGIEFRWSSLTTSQKDLLDLTTSGVDDNQGELRLNYLRGDAAMEVPNGAFRARSSRLGDIINSDPTYVGQQNYGFDLLPGSEGSSYKTYRKSSAYKNRAPMVYVAANDGMLHGFEVATGEELLAYMPNAVFPELTYLTNPSFNGSHRLINDGAPWGLDAYLGGAWKSILLGSLGAGGKGVYALDVSNPESFDANDVLWEFTSANDSNMGVAIPQSTIARMYNGKWAAIVSNGYNSGGNAELFILDLETGAKLKEIDTGVGGDNGLSSATPVDVDGDRIVDYIYAGDLMGNMWKFDVTSSNPTNWAVAFSGAPLYTACSADPCTTTNRQPITAPPEVGLSPPAGYFVYFGTGRYFAVGDNAAGTVANSIYAIRDTNEKGTVSTVLPGAGRSTLVQQSVLGDGAGREINFDGNIERIRLTTKNAITDAADGWFLNLPLAGERQISSPVLRAGRLLFTTIVPSGDACSAGGDSWLMELDALSGSRLRAAPIDLNGDHSFNRDDFVRVDPNDPDSELVAVTGLKSKVGIIKTPGIVSEDGHDYLFEGGSKCEEGDKTCVKPLDTNPGGQRGRQSWREIQ